MNTKESIYSLTGRVRVRGKREKKELKVCPAATPILFFPLFQNHRKDP